MDSKLEKSALAIKDYNVISAIDSIFKNINAVEVLSDYNLLDKFTSNYRKWLITSNNIELIGLSKFKYATYIHGTVQGFDLFYAEFSQRRFRCFRGEFLYHTLSWRNNYNFKYLDDNILDKNDAVVISIPFSDNGAIHPDTNVILKQCDELNIPVLIDSAYINLSKNISINLNHKCIHTICFSLSKTFYSVDRLRVGLRLQKKFNDDPIDVFNSFKMVNNIGLHVAINLMNIFNSDYIVEKYSKKQNQICKKFNLIPSNCINFGLGNNEYCEFNRGGEFNRVCISRLLNNV